MTIVNDATDFGNLIRTKRKELRYTQEDLARRIGVSRQWVLKTERGAGRPELEPLLRALFELGLGLRVEELDPPDDLDAFVRSFTDAITDEGRKE